MTTKCKCLGHLLKATSQSEFVFHQFSCFLGFMNKSTNKTGLCFAIFTCSKKLQKMFEVGLRNCEVIIQKSFLEM